MQIAWKLRIKFGNWYKKEIEAVISLLLFFYVKEIEINYIYNVTN